jgi:hypothetical protein
LYTIRENIIIAACQGRCMWWNMALRVMAHCQCSYIMSKWGFECHSGIPM